MTSCVYAHPVLINSSSIFKVYLDRLIKLLDLTNVTESPSSLECFWEIQIILRNSVKFTLMGQEIWKSLQVNCEHLCRRWMCTFWNVSSCGFFVLVFVCVPITCSCALNTKKAPTALLEYSLLRAACTHNIVHDSFNPNAVAASCLLFSYSLFLFSHCFISGFVTD